MAQTKKKRRRKHRGTQAGTVGGRRTRPRSRAEARAQAKARGRSKKKKGGKAAIGDRVGSPPTWRGAVNRAVIAAGIFLAVLVLLFGQPFTQALALAAFMVLFYIPMGYYMDHFFHRMRQRREAKRRAEATSARNAG